MSRIFLMLAATSLILMLATGLAGFALGDLYGQVTTGQLRWATIHRLSGLASALSVVFVHSIALTYLIGTARWAKEVGQTYPLDSALLREAARLKQRTFPWNVGGMLTVVGVIALGAAADPATGQPDTQAWSRYHLFGSIAGSLLIAWSYYVTFENLRSIQAVFGRIISEVRQIRIDRGLPVDDLAADNR